MGDIIIRSIFFSILILFCAESVLASMTMDKIKQSTQGATQDNSFKKINTEKIDSDELKKARGKDRSAADKKNQKSSEDSKACYVAMGKTHFICDNMKVPSTGRVKSGQYLETAFQCAKRFKDQASKISSLIKKCEASIRKCQQICAKTNTANSCSSWRGKVGKFKKVRDETRNASKSCSASAERICKKDSNGECIVDTSKGDSINAADAMKNTNVDGKEFQAYDSSKNNLQDTVVNNSPDEEQQEKLEQSAAAIEAEQQQQALWNQLTGAEQPQKPLIDQQQSDEDWERFVQENPGLLKFDADKLMAEYEKENPPLDLGFVDANGNERVINYTGGPNDDLYIDAPKEIKESYGGLEPLGGKSIPLPIKKGTEPEKPPGFRPIVETKKDTTPTTVTKVKKSEDPVTPQSGGGRDPQKDSGGGQQPQQQPQKQQAGGGNNGFGGGGGLNNGGVNNAAALANNNSLNSGNNGFGEFTSGNSKKSNYKKNNVKITPPKNRRVSASDRANSGAEEGESSEDGKGVGRKIASLSPQSARGYAGRFSGGRSGAGKKKKVEKEEYNESAEEEALKKQKGSGGFFGALGKAGNAVKKFFDKGFTKERSWDKKKKNKGYKKASDLAGPNALLAKYRDRMRGGRGLASTTPPGFTDRNTFIFSSMCLSYFGYQKENEISNGQTWCPKNRP